MSKSNDYLKALGANYNLIRSKCQIKDEIKKIMQAQKGCDKNYQNDS